MMKKLSVLLLRGISISFEQNLVTNDSVEQYSFDANNWVSSDSNLIVCYQPSGLTPDAYILRH